MHGVMYIICTNINASNVCDIITAIIILKAYLIAVASVLASLRIARRLFRVAATDKPCLFTGTYEQHNTQLLRAGLAYCLDLQVYSVMMK